MSNTQVFIVQEGGGFLLVFGELVFDSSLKLVDELDEVAVTVLTQVFGAHVCQLIFALDVVDTDLHCQSCRLKLYLHRGLYGYSATLKLIGALASSTMYDDVDLPLSGLLLQLASEKAASRKPPCL